MFWNVVRVVALVVSLIIEIPLGIAIWRITAFLRPELIHDKLMTLGDVSISFIERTKIEAIWIPFGIMITVFSWFQIRILIDFWKEVRKKGL